MTGYQPIDGEHYWCIRGVWPRRVECLVWEGDRLDQLLRDAGLTFKTEQEALAALATQKD